MKLVDILARELKEWPDSKAVTQDQSGRLNYLDRGKSANESDFLGSEWASLNWSWFYHKVELADDFRKAIVTRAEWQAAVDALKEEFVPFDFSGPVLDYGPKEWTGEGLPPVGAELEAGFACEGFRIWHRGVCVAVGEDPEGREDVCVVQFGKKIAQYSGEGRCMRPIRTPEQIAAEEREKGIEELRANAPGIAWKSAAAIYDAGYRKQVAP